MRNPFKLPTLQQRLQTLLEEAKEARVNASARKAHWENQEEFLISEIERLKWELKHLTPPEAPKRRNLP